MAIQVPLTQGKTALIDEKDEEAVNQYKWCAHRLGRNWYAATTIRVCGKQKTLHMHRLLAAPDEGMFVDHKNHDGLDNRRSNIRICTPSENGRNRRKQKGNYKGVYFFHGKWVARITKNKRLYQLGRYETQRQAAISYNRVARRLFGEFAKLNQLDIQK